MAWTTINLYVAIVMLGLFVAIAYFHPQWKWLIILIAAVQAGVRSFIITFDV
jgi:hypothetical protein